MARVAASSRFALVLNSDKGPRRQPPSYSDVMGVFSDPRIVPNETNVLPGLELRGDSVIADLQRFSGDFASRQCVVIHKGHTFDENMLLGAVQFSIDPVHVFVEPGVSSAAFASLPATAKILVRDGFNACGRNADYPARSAFDDIVFQYAARQFDALGDFCAIGDQYSDTGGPARAVALHLTEGNGRTLVMNHFVSDDSDLDAPTMYLQAVRKLATYLSRNPRPGMNTNGVRMFIQSNADQLYPGLGMAKRWSTMHHVEVVLRILESQGTVASF